MLRLVHAFHVPAIFVIAYTLKALTKTVYIVVHPIKSTLFEKFFETKSLPNASVIIININITATSTNAVFVCIIIIFERCESFQMRKLFAIFLCLQQV